MIQIFPVYVLAESEEELKNGIFKYQEQAKDSRAILAKVESRSEFETVILTTEEIEAAVQVLSDVLFHRYDGSKGMPEDAYYALHALKRRRTLLLPLDNEKDNE